MKKQFDSQAATAAVREPDAGLLFSEIGLSATFFDSMPVEIVLVGETGEVLAANDKFRREFGEALGLVWTSFLIDDPVEVGQNLVVAFNRGSHSFRVFYKTSGEFQREFQIEAFRLSGNTNRVALIHRPNHSQTGFCLPERKLRSGDLRLKDIPGRTSEETQFRELFELYRIFVNQSDHEVYRFDISDPISCGLVPDAAASLIQSAAVLTSFVDSLSEDHGSARFQHPAGTTFEDFFGSRETSFEIAEHFVNGDYSLFKKEILETSAEGRESFFSINLVGVIEEGKLYTIWLSTRDITIRKQAEKSYMLAEDQLRQSQKIEPIGRLAGGIAHDFNNFLAVIMLQIEMMNQELDESSPLRRRVGEIRTVTSKAANMVKQLLAFGRKQTLQPRHVILNAVVKEFIKMTESLIGEDIEIELDLAEDLGVCFVDPNQITQILMNLAINSKDAMPGGGKLRISTKNLTIDEDTFKHRAQPKARYIQFSVEDTGTGMDPSTRKHVFEPFFTTKKGHKGTGLGLATVYGIVKQSNGFIWVDSKIDEGSRFRVQFPRTDSTAAIIKPERIKPIPRGNETILLVEDEELIRKTSVEVLSSLGYTILEARDGEEAVRIASGFEGEIHLLLTDVVMPRMNGRELAKKVKPSYPNLSVLFMSGYADDIITRHGILEKDVHFLGKPFSPLTLAVQVREALGG